uniref:trypsin n=1 Tax=Spodoptera exigua TaxID=7107 RepID=Q3ZJD2_SPOEX|nr:midgut chymotrypsin [Spodoptera exigua]
MEFSKVLFLFIATTSFVFGVPLSPSDHQPFIIGGEDAPEGSAPYTVALIFGERVMFQLCGASLISRRLMLTAAHCIESFIADDGGLLKTLHSRVGSNQWNSGGTMVYLKGYHMHPQWDSTNIKYDTAVLVTREPVHLTDRVTLISLSYEFIEGNERSFVAGWGRTGPRFEENVIHLQPTPDDKQVLYMNTLDYDQCQEQMKIASNNNAPPIERDIELCTFHSRGHGMCFGDSGSALVRLSTMQQIGIVSWGYNCAVGAPDVHVRIYGIKDFLESTMALYED